MTDDPYADSTLQEPASRGHNAFLRGEECIRPRDLRYAHDKWEEFKRGFKFAGCVAKNCNIRARRRQQVREQMKVDYRED